MVHTYDGVPGCGYCCCCFGVPHFGSRWSVWVCVAAWNSLQSSDGDDDDDDDDDDDTENCSCLATRLLTLPSPETANDNVRLRSFVSAAP